MYRSFKAVYPFRVQVMTKKGKEREEKVYKVTSGILYFTNFVSIPPSSPLD